VGNPAECIGMGAQGLAPAAAACDRKMERGQATPEREMWVGDSVLHRCPIKWRGLGRGSGETWKHSRDLKTERKKKGLVLRVKKVDQDGSKEEVVSGAGGLGQTGGESLRPSQSLKQLVEKEGGRCWSRKEGQP